MLKRKNQAAKILMCWNRHWNRMVKDKIYNNFIYLYIYLSSPWFIDRFSWFSTWNRHNMQFLFGYTIISSSIALFFEHLSKTFSKTEI